MNDAVELYTVRSDVQCLRCGCRGAVQSYGKYYPEGVGELADKYKSFESVKDKPYLSAAMGFGGTIPWRCLNCGNTGLADQSGLEGFKQAFQTIR